MDFSWARSPFVGLPAASLKQTIPLRVTSGRPLLAKSGHRVFNKSILTKPSVNGLQSQDQLVFPINRFLNSMSFVGYETLI